MKREHPTGRKIRVDALFTDYRIISHSNNEIMLNLPTNALSATLRSASAEHTGSNEAVMKLVKRNKIPVLSFEIFGSARRKWAVASKWRTMYAWR